MRKRRFVFDGHEFIVDRGVFDPVKHLSGLVFAEHLGSAIAECAPGARTALDLGTGCGLLAATLARLGLGVVATDSNKAAVACAAQNCAGLAVDIRRGDLFVPVVGESFDVLVVNPPYEQARPRWWQTSALTSPDFLQRLGQAHEFAPVAIVGFPADDAAALKVTGLDLELWRSIETAGRPLGLFVSVHAPGAWTL